MRNEVARSTVVFRKRKTTDDTFIVHVALNTMQHVFSQSTGSRLSKAMIRNQLAVNTTTMIIENRNRPIGYYCYTILPNKLMYLAALVLAPDVQGKGIGGYVVTHIEREALANKVYAINAHVQIANRRAIAFWMKHGYRIVGHRVNGMFAIEKVLTKSIRNATG